MISFSHFASFKIIRISLAFLELVCVRPESGFTVLFYTVIFLEILTLHCLFLLASHLFIHLSTLCLKDFTTTGQEKITIITQTAEVQKARLFLVAKELLQTERYFVFLLQCISFSFSR